jgi:hypothetical protein
MSIGRQFKRIGEISAAFGLWRLVAWVISKPIILVIVLIGMLLALIGIGSVLDQTGKTHYVNVNSLELLDKPFGKKVKTLHLNDSLVLVREMSDQWMQVAVDKDTLYFKENSFWDPEEGFVYKIDRTPFTKWKALKGKHVVLNHPDGYFEAGGSMLRNGDAVEVISYSESDSVIHIRASNGDKSEISVKYVKINWAPIYKKYPKLGESN